MNILTVSYAKVGEVAEISELMEASIRVLQQDYLTEAQIESSFAGMGLDTQLIADQTFFCVREGETLIGCGGWSRRATLHGGDHSADRDNRLLDPLTERARIRAMYAHPDHARKGAGRLILAKAEDAARSEGFRALEMAATLAGIPFYKRCGYYIESEWDDLNGAVPVPLATMVKILV